MAKQIRFIDNTDPAGIDHQIAQLGDELASTLVIVISKVCMEVSTFACFVILHIIFSRSMLRSYLLPLLVQSGGTPETRNGLLEVQKAFREAGLVFSKQVLVAGFCFFLYQSHLSFVIEIIKGYFLEQCGCCFPLLCSSFTMKMGYCKLQT